MIIACTDIPSQEDDNLSEMRKEALRDAVICIGWLKLVSVIYYLCMYYLVHIFSKGEVSSAIQIMLLVAIPLQVLHGTLLFYGALDSKLDPLEVGIWMCLIIASYNTIIGTTGFIFFIRTGHKLMHFLLAFAFIILAFSLFTALCHDILMVYAYKQILHRVREENNLEPVQQVRSIA